MEPASGADPTGASVSVNIIEKTPLKVQCPPDDENLKETLRILTTPLASGPPPLLRNSSLFAASSPVASTPTTPGTRSPTNDRSNIDLLKAEFGELLSDHSLDASTVSFFKTSVTLFRRIAFSVFNPTSRGNLDAEELFLVIDILSDLGTAFRNVKTRLLEVEKRIDVADELTPLLERLSLRNSDDERGTFITAAVDAFKDRICLLRPPPAVTADLMTCLSQIYDDMIYQHVIDESRLPVMSINMIKLGQRFTNLADLLWDCERATWIVTVDVGFLKAVHQTHLRNLEKIPLARKDSEEIRYWAQQLDELCDGGARSRKNPKRRALRRAETSAPSAAGGKAEWLIRERENTL